MLNIGWNSEFSFSALRAKTGKLTEEDLSKLWDKLEGGCKGTGSLLTLASNNDSEMNHISTVSECESPYDIILIYFFYIQELVNEQCISKKKISSS